MTQPPENYHELSSTESFDRVENRLQLRCKSCGQIAQYNVGTVILHPSILLKPERNALNDAFGCTAYFRCQFCDAGGPWEVTPDSIHHLADLLAELVTKPNTSRVRIGEVALFDGTRTRVPTDGEAHLKGLIAKRPDYYFLYNRLGNLYKSSHAPQLAVQAFTEALKRNEHDVESHHSLGQLCELQGDAEGAGEHFRQVLAHARHCPDESVTVLRKLVAYALIRLGHLYHNSGGKIAMFPKIEVPPTESSEPRVLELVHLDTSKREDQERLIDMWIGKRMPRPERPVPHAGGPGIVISPRQPSRPVTTTRRAGRNDPCPCGSGKKYKVCCAR